MSIASIAKRAAIDAGLYRPARWLARRLRPSQRRAHEADVRFFKGLLEPGMLCFDVGANIGEKSEAMLAAGGRVVAFEPNTELLSELQARCGKDPNWSCVPTAVGREPGLARLFAREQHGQSSLRSEWDGKIVAVRHVPMITLDMAIATFGPPAFCKVDVEGWELEVLNGLSQSIPLVCFEFHLTVEGVARALACLRRLADLDAAHVNLVASEGARFQLSEWMAIPRFLNWFPGNLGETLPGYLYGDIYVARDIPSFTAASR